MHHWRQDYFKTLREIGDAAGSVPEWAGYASFCFEYERGLRPRALAILEQFISGLERSPFQRRRAFVSWLLLRTEGRAGRHLVVPHPLQIRIVEPTLSEWTIVEPGSSEPHRWIGGREHLVQAIELNPNDELARRKLVIHILSHVGTHELPRTYVGSPQDDLKGLRDAEEHLQHLTDESVRNSLAAQVAEEIKLIEDYLRAR